MDFRLTEEQEMLKKTIRKLAEEQFKPLASRWDENEEFPWENIKRLSELGFLGLMIPEKYGGGGAKIIDFVIMLEEIAKVCAATAGPLLIHTGVSSKIITLFGNEELKKRILPPLAKGEKIAAFAMTEPEAGSAATDLKTTAAIDGDYYIINGRKCFISLAGLADVYSTILRIADAPKGIAGIGAILIEKGMPGFSFGTIEKKMGVRGFKTGELIFEDCKVPKENLLLGEGGFKKAITAFNGERCGNAAICLGIAEGALEVALNYSKERKAFGRDICEFQGIQWMLADMKVKVDAAQALIYKAAANADVGSPSQIEASVAKTFANEMAIEVTNNAVQILGGYGYTRDYPVERMMRDAKAFSLGGGTPQMQRNMIASLILGRKFSQRRS